MVCGVVWRFGVGCWCYWFGLMYIVLWLFCYVSFWGYGLAQRFARWVWCCGMVFVVYLLRYYICFGLCLTDGLQGTGCLLFAGHSLCCWVSAV